MEKKSKKSCEIIRDYYISCENIKKLFKKTYFRKNNVIWVGDTIGGIIEVCDCYFSLSDMVTLLKNNVSFNKMMGWYENTIEDYDKHGHISISLENYIKFGKLYNEYKN